MAELRTLVEHELERAGSPSYSFDDLARNRERKRRNRRIVAGLVGLAVAILVLGGLLTELTLDRSTPAEPDVTPSPGGLPSTPEAWTRVGFPDGTISSVTAGGSGLVAVGASVSGSSIDWLHATPAIWVSTDGRSWTTVGGAIGSGPFVDATAGGPGIVAVKIGSGVFGLPGGAPVWISDDGLTWTQAQSGPVFDGAWLRAVTSGGSGVVAVGSDPNGPMAWWSADGVRWTKATLPPLPDAVDVFEGRTEAWITDVAAGGGRFVAVGAIGLHVDDPEGGGTRYDPAVWTSVDGLSWTEADTDAFPRQMQILAVTSGPNGFVAAGEKVSREPWIWTSPDGVSWTPVDRGQAAFASLAPVPSDQERFDLYLEIHSVIGTRAGYIAVGQDGWCIYGSPFLCKPAAAALWTSPDGRVWTRVGADPRFELGRRTRVISAPIAVWGDRLVAVANHGGGTDIWISEGQEGA